MADTRELKWYPQGSDTPAGSTLAPGTYYADLEAWAGSNVAHAHQFDWNATLAASITFQSTLKGTARVHLDAPRDWSPATGLGTINIVAGAEGSELVPVPAGEAELAGLRAVAVVTVEGELLGRTR